MQNTRENPHHTHGRAVSESRAHVRNPGTAALAILASCLMIGPALADPVQLGRTMAGHPTIDLSIDDSGPFTFVFDTGASHSAIALPVARDLGFDGAIAASDEVQALTTLFEAELFTLQNVRVGSTPARSFSSVVLPADDGPLPVVGFLAPGDINIDRYSVNFGSGELDLDAPALSHRDGILHSELGLLFGRARLGARSVEIAVMIDTGTPRSFVNTALRRYLPHRTFSLTYRIAGVDNKDTTDGTPIRIRRLNMGGLCMSRVDVLYSELDIFSALGWSDRPAMVVGMDILNSAQLTVDQTTGHFELSALAGSDSCRDRTQLEDLPEITLG